MCYWFQASIKVNHPTMIIDVQNDFISGPMANDDAASIIPVINRLRQKSFDLVGYTYFSKAEVDLTTVYTLALLLHIMIMTSNSKNITILDIFLYL